MSDRDHTERLFLAIELDDDTRHGLAARLGTAVTDLPGRAVAPHNWHLTLRFLGWTGPDQRDGILRHLEEHAGPGPFTLAFGGIGAFPKPRRATVVWVAVTETAATTGRLLAAAAAAEEAALGVGFAPEDRPFHPHLTLSRVRPPVDVTALVEQTPVLGLRQRVDHVTLYRSRLQRGGAEYEVVDRVPL